MKKILFVAMAAAAMTFTSCGEKKTAEAIDAQAVAEMTDATQVEGAAQQAVSALKAQLENADKAQVEAVMAKVVEAAQGLLNNGNVEGATQYVQTVANFVKENQEQLAALGIDTSNLIPASVYDAVSAATNLQQQAEGVCTDAQEQVENAGEALQNAAEDAANQAVQQAQDAANQAAQQASQAAQNAVNNAAQQANDAVNSAAQEALRRIPGAQ